MMLQGSRNGRQGLVHAVIRWEYVWFIEGATSLSQFTILKKVEATHLKAIWLQTTKAEEEKPISKTKKKTHLAGLYLGSGARRPVPRLWNRLCGESSGLQWTSPETEESERWIGRCVGVVTTVVQHMCGNKSNMLTHVTRLISDVFPAAFECENNVQRHWT